MPTIDRFNQQDIFTSLNKSNQVFIQVIDIRNIDRKSGLWLIIDFI